jgi:elongation factor G
MSEMVDSLRNIALIAHGGAGKTSVAEAMLYNAGVTKRLGRVEEGNTAMDFEPEEIKRTSSITRWMALKFKPNRPGNLPKNLTSP